MRNRIIPLLLLFLVGCTAMPEIESRATQQARLYLQSVPLDKLNHQEAYARYGPVSRVIQLPNGHVGWVYAANDKRFAERTYTLEFSGDGLMSDIVYTSYSGQTISARAIQDQNPEAQR